MIPHLKIFYCSCGIKTEVPKGKAKECKCGKVFGVRSENISDYINMRKSPLSGTTKMEVSYSTVEESAKKMKG